MNISFSNYKQYKEYFRQLIDFEREEQIRLYKEEIKKLSGKLREKLGRAILNLKGKDQGKAVGGYYLVKFTRKTPFETQINPADIVLISKGQPKNSNPQGIVYEKRLSSITVAFSGKPPRFVYGKNLRIDLYANDVTFQRMEEALDKLKDCHQILEIILGKRKPEFSSFQGKIDFVNKELNSSQKEAVEKALKAKDIFLIHGPPGTGKTTTLVEIILQEIKRGKRVLCCADSNIAVDNLVESLTKYNVKVVRIGNPVRIIPSVLKCSLDYVVRNSESYKKVERIWKEIERLRNQQENFLKPLPQYRRGLSDEEIIKLARLKKGARGVSAKLMKKMADWLLVQFKINDLFQEAKKIEEEIITRVLKDADVLCTTNSTAGSEILENKEFDLVCIDEATQATEPSCIIPIIKGKKIVMAGDHKQLPPTVVSEKAKALEFTLFERFLKLYGEEIKALLKLQYRMHEKIMGFSNKYFYNKALISHHSVAHHTIADLNLKLNRLSQMEPQFREICKPENVCVFIDTRGKYPEKRKKDSTSWQNPGEAKFIKEILNALVQIGVKTKDIGIITPYDDQCDILKRYLKRFKDLEIKTVDGFQGREKEIIIVSFVRSNKKGEIGFLEDLRRLNVCLTRARKKLIIVGDSFTLSKNKFYKLLIEYFKENGKIIKLN